MWHPSSNEATIPPNVLKNFNVYDTLEPQRTGAKTSVEQNTAKLIDIDECSRDSGFQDSDTNAAFLDKDRDFDLVDLFQNILVSPQHITKNEKKRKDVATAINVNDVDFKDFFDKLESGKKIDWSKNELVKEEKLSKNDSDELLEKPRVLIPKVFTEPDSDPEDLINEVLTKKSIEKQMLDEINKLSNVHARSNWEIPKKINNPDISRLNLNNSFTKDSKIESAKTANVPRPSHVETCPLNRQINNSLVNFPVIAMQKDEKVYKKKRIVKPVSQTSNYTKGPDFYEKSIVLPQIMARFGAIQKHIEEKNNQKRRLILDAGSKTVPKAECSNINMKNVLKKESNNTSDGTNTVKPGCIPVNKDPKLCMNQSTQSIAVHTTAKAYTNCKSPLVLKKVCSPLNVASASVRDGYGKLSPTVLMEDCNRERLRAWKQGQIFKNFVLTGKYDI